MGKAIGIYGGTFDPIHLGHLSLAMEILEARSLDEVWFCPAFISPHRLHEKPTAAEHRLNMLKLSLEDEPRFQILDTEIKRQTPSYTVDTIEELLATQAGKKDPHHFSLILGEDALPGFFSWHKPEEIVRLVPLWVGARSPFVSAATLQGDAKVVESIQKGMTKTRILDISSTDIRRRLQAGLSCRYLVPAKVLDYILTHRLYYKV